MDVWTHLSTSFIPLQFGSAQGYVNINWKKMQGDVVRAVDPDGDGQLTKKDAKLLWKRFLAFAQRNLPSSSGFAGGFVLGITCA